MLGHHPERVTAGARVGGGALVLVLAQPVTEIGDVGDGVGADVLQLVLGVHLTGDDLHLDVLGTQRAEPDLGGKADGTTDLDGLARHAFDPLDHHRAPGLPDPVLPRRQLLGLIRHRGLGLRRRHVQLGDVIAHHARGDDLGAKTGDGLADHGDPLHRQTGGIARVELGRDLVLHDVVEEIGLVAVPLGGVGDVLRRRNLPPERRVVPLVPPAVSDGEVGGAVERGLHARGPAGLVGAKRVVHPHVAARVKRPGHGHVVIGEEHDALADLGVVSEEHHLLDERLADLIGRVRLAGNDDLDGPFWVVQHCLEARNVGKHQRQALVGGAATSEPEGQHAGVQRAVDPLGRAGESAIAVALAKPLARHLHEIGPHRALERPDGVGVHAIQRRPVVAVEDVLEIAGGRLQQFQQLGVHPGAVVHAVGD